MACTVIGRLMALGRKVKSYGELCRIVDEEKLRVGIITREEFYERYEKIFIDETHEEEQEGIQEVIMTLEIDDMSSLPHERDAAHELQRLLLSKKITKDEYKQKISEHEFEKVRARAERLNSILVQNKAPEGTTNGACLTVAVTKSGDILDSKRLDYVAILAPEAENRIREIDGVTLTVTGKYVPDECSF